MRIMAPAAVRAANSAEKINERVLDKTATSFLWVRIPYLKGMHLSRFGGKGCARDEFVVKYQ